MCLPILALPYQGFPTSASFTCPPHTLRHRILGLAKLPVDSSWSPRVLFPELVVSSATGTPLTAKMQRVASGMATVEWWKHHVVSGICESPLTNYTKRSIPFLFLGVLFGSV